MVNNRLLEDYAKRLRLPTVSKNYVGGSASHPAVVCRSIDKDVRTKCRLTLSAPVFRKA